eukprot:scaffold117434_cov17-Tisochrysis_lutea.AAC.1
MSSSVPVPVAQQPLSFYHSNPKAVLSSSSFTTATLRLHSFPLASSQQPLSFSHSNLQALLFPSSFIAATFLHRSNLCPFITAACVVLSQQGLTASPSCQPHSAHKCLLTAARNPSMGAPVSVVASCAHACAALRLRLYHMAC